AASGYPWAWSRPMAASWWPSRTSARARPSASRSRSPPSKTSMADTYDLDGALGRIRGAASLDDLRSVEAELLGKRSEVAAMHTRLGGLAPDDRRDAGRAINDLRATLTDAVAQRRAAIEEGGREARLASDRIDLTEAVRRPGVGRGAR